jgi:serine protease Do
MSHPHRTVHGWIPITLIGASLLAAGSVVFVVGYGRESGGESRQPPPFPPLQTASPQDLLPTQRTELQRIEARCVKVVRKVQPTVVGVISPSQASRPRPKRHARGASGVIITADGLVLSQMHVSHTRPGSKDFSDPHKPGEEATVLFADGKERKAKLLGASRVYDLSLLQLSEPGPYPFVPLRSDVKVRTGDWVVKLGHPLGFRKDRPAPARLGRVLGSDSETFVSDCPTTGGDSGGPFFDLDGRLVGIINFSDESLGSERPQERPEDTHGHRASIMSAISVPRIATLIGSMKKGELSPDSGREPFMLSGSADRLPAEQWTQGAKTKGIFEPTTQRLRTSVVTILNGGVPIALGTVVDKDGLAVVNASHIPLRPECRLPDGTTVDVTVVGVDKPFDLAVIRIPPKSIRPVLWADRDSPPAGRIVAAVGPDGRPLKVGVVSVATRKLADAEAPTYDLPLRIKVDKPEIVGEPSKVGSGYKVLRASGLAKVVGIEPGDRLVSIAGRQIAADQDLAESVSDKRSGDVVSVVLIRGGKTMTLQLPLLPEVLNKETTPSASYATWRLDDFPIALEYSPPVTTTECGGPLVDLSGRVIGITVGRSESHAGWAIPADEVQRLVVDAKNGKLSMWPAR